MKVWVIGAGLGNPSLLTGAAREALARSGAVIGAARLLDAFGELLPARRLEAALPERMAEALRACGDCAQAALLVSGDPGFYSAARRLEPLLGGCEVEFIPGVSSVQYLCAKLRTSWDDAQIVSLHGRGGDLAGAAAHSPKVFVLTGGENSPGALCARLAESGLGEARVWVGERLSYPDERITAGTAAGLAGGAFGALCAMLIENPAAKPRPVSPGLPDGAFLRGQTPMTKEEVRAVSIAKLRLRRGMTVWDVGAGTGSVSVELARVLADGAVYAVERDADACALIEQNRARFGLGNLRLARGEAPEALAGLPAPDAVFIGGSSGNLAEIFGAALERNPAVRIVANAVTLETLTAALECCSRFSLGSPDVAQLSVARIKEAGRRHMMLAQNPVWIVSVGGVEG